MKLMNLTPHAVTFIRKDGSTVVVERDTNYQVPRLGTIETPLGEVDGIEWVRSTFQECSTLPEEKDDTLIIVSQLVASANPQRKDLVFPCDLVRDDKGVIVGCRKLGSC